MKIVQEDKYQWRHWRNAVVPLQMKLSKCVYILLMEIGIAQKLQCVHSSNKLYKLDQYVPIYLN